MNWLAIAGLYWPIAVMGSASHGKRSQAIASGRKCRKRSQASQASDVSKGFRFRRVVISNVLLERMESCIALKQKEKKEKKEKKGGMSWSNEV